MSAATTIRIYTTEYRQPLPDAVFSRLLGQVPLETREKAKRFRRWEDAYGCLFGRLLLKAGLAEQGSPFKLDNLQYSSYGRPFFEGGPDFSISHSGVRVVCLISRAGRVGIDLELIKELELDHFSEQFTVKEWEAISQADDPVGRFYAFWTAKESVIKADGRGLGLPLNSVVVEAGSRVQVEKNWWNILPVADFLDYACCIATEAKVYDYELIEMDYLSILSK